MNSKYMTVRKEVGFPPPGKWPINATEPPAIVDAGSQVTNKREKNDCELDAVQ